MLNPKSVKFVWFDDFLDVSANIAGAPAVAFAKNRAESETPVTFAFTPYIPTLLPKVKRK